MLQKKVCVDLYQLLTKIVTINKYISLKIEIYKNVRKICPIYQLSTKQNKRHLTPVRLGSLLA